MPTNERWPSLTVDSWSDTRETLHMWLQVVGKVQMVSTPLLNHWWNVTFAVSPRGLRTRTMYCSGQPFDAEFDFVADELVIRTAKSDERVPLEPQSVATFYGRTRDALSALGLSADIWPAPNEIDPAIPFAQDTEQRAYDPDAVRTWWQQLLSISRVFTIWRAGFAGKDSPVELFWGSMDLSCIRYSGRPAPLPTGSHIPNCPPWVMQEAEFRENSSAGFWAGGSAEGSFYAYCYPQPDGYTEATGSVGTFDADLGEWILPYEQVRTSDDPDALLLTFLEQTYGLAADLGHWDRALLDVDPHRLDKHLYRGVDRSSLY